MGLSSGASQIVNYNGCNILLTVSFENDASLGNDYYNKDCRKVGS